MPNPFLMLLILVQIGIDITIIVVFVLLIRKLRYLKKGQSLDHVISIFRSFLSDAEKVAEQFNAQLREKQSLIKGLNEQLDKRVTSLNVLLNRADVLLSSENPKTGAPKGEPNSTGDHRAKILELSKKGEKPEEIAHQLSIPRGEVKLILDLREKFARADKK